MIVLIQQQRSLNYSLTMRTKLTVAASTVAGLLASFVGIAKADALFEIPTSTVSSFTGAISDQLSDPGTLLVLGVVLALPASFWIIHRIKALFPKASGR